MKAQLNSMKNTLNHYNRIVLATTLLLGCAALAPLSTARGSATLVLSNIWSLAQGSRYYLPNSGDPRGVGMNPVTGDILIPSIQGGSNHVAVLDANGNDLGSLSGSGITGGTKAICLVGASDDGVIYGCNLATSGQGFIVYRWPTEDVTGATPPLALALNTPFGATGGRLGDSFAVRGAGTNTQFVVSGVGMSKFAVFTTTDGTNFTPTVFNFPSGLAAGQAAHGLSFDSTNNALFASKESGPAVHYIGFDLGTATATWLGDFTAGQAWSGISVTYLTAFATNTVRVLAGVYDNGASGPGTHQLQVYDISNTNSPILSTNSPFPTPVGGNGNETAGTAIGHGMIVGFDTANGLQALAIGFQANVPPSIATQPTDQTNVLAGGYASFAVTASGSIPLKYQWYFTDPGNLATNKVTWAVSTNASLNLTNLVLTNAGYYSVVVTNNYGAQTSVLAVLNVVPSIQTAAFVPTWSKGAGSLFFLSVNNTERGLGYNPVNGHLIVVSRTPTNGVHVLDAATGNYLHSLDMSAVGTAGSFFPINLAAVADDGAVYVANLDAGTQYEIYRWADDSASTVATVAYGPLDPGLGDRIGDTFAVRGAGANTEILAASRDNATIVLFNTSDGLTFNPTIIDTTPQPVGLAGLGLAWGAGTTFWTKSSGFQFRHIIYDLTAGTNGLLQTFTAGQLTDLALGVDPTNNLIASLVPNTAGGVGPRSLPDHLDLYDVNAVVNDPTGSTEPTLIDQDLYPTDNENGNGTGAVAFDVAGGRLFALDTNNGLLAGKVVARLFETSSGSGGVLTWTGPSKLLFSSVVVGPYATNAVAISPYTNTAAGAEFFHLAR